MGFTNSNIPIMDPCDEIIKLSVNSTSPTIVNVHRDVLCKTSEYFQRALKPEWASLRPDPHIIDMSDDSLSIVKIYVNWLYSSAIPVPLIHRANEAATDDMLEEIEKVYITLASAFVFGSKMLDSKFKTAVTERFMAAKSACIWNPGPASVGIIYAGTPAKCALRRLVADFIAYEAFDDGHWIRYMEGYPQEALADAMKVMVKVRAMPEITTRPYSGGSLAYLDRGNEVEDCSRSS